MTERASGKKDRLGALEKAYIFLLLVVFGGIVLHAPLSVGFGTLLPDYDLLIKSWKEILMGVAAVIALVLLRRHGQAKILREPLMIGVEAYAAVHLLSLALFRNNLDSTLAGLMIDLRYVLFFTLVYVAVRLFPGLRQMFIKVGIAGALVVVVFALLQAFVLPVDVLKYIGYDVNNIAPYLTVDQNPDFIRINSTLRGPNPLGAYAVIILAPLVAWLVARRSKSDKKPALIVATLIFGGIVSLWASYSRSALIAAVIATVVVLGATVMRKASRRAWLIAGVVFISILGVLVAARDSNLVSNIILHENPGESNSINSNEGHVNSLQEGIDLLVMQPFGAGIGSAGSASLLDVKPLIIENQYLFIAHETGWLGLAVFTLIFVGIMNRLWVRRKDWLALGVFASGLGMAVIGLFLPVWTDDTVAIVWWGLAAVVIGGGLYNNAKAKKL